MEALTMILIDSLKPDLIILDLDLPFLSGQEILRIIRHRPEFDNIPILICSGVSSAETVQEIVKHRIDGYVTKPINRMQLLGKILPLLKIDQKTNLEYGY